MKIIAEGLGNDDDFGLFSLTTSTIDTHSIAINLYKDVSGNRRFKLRYHIAAGWQTDTGATNLALDTWYGIRLYVNNPAGGGSDVVQWWVDYNLDGTYTEEGNFTALTLDRDIANIIVSPAIGTTKTLNVQITGLKIDNDTMPSECAR